MLLGPLALSAEAHDESSNIARNYTVLLGCCADDYSAQLDRQFIVGSRTAGMERRNSEIFGSEKAGITGYARSLASSLAPQIRVNEIAPSWTETSCAESKMVRNYRESIVSNAPMRCFGRSEDVALAVVYIASDQFSFVTRHAIAVNGGLSC